MKRKTKSELRKEARRQLAAWRKRTRRNSRLRRSAPSSGRVARPPIKEICITPPKNFNFSNNYDETVSCLQLLKSSVFKPANKQGNRQPVAIDIAAIETVSVAGALVLAAEIDRWRKFTGRRMRPRNLRMWNPEVRDLLESLGFFELLDVSDSQIASTKINDEMTTVTVLPMISNTELDQRLLASLSKISEALHSDPTIYGALVEAAYNVGKHAYPDGYRWRFPPVVKGWWATASLDPAANCVKFLVYDQGVGIVETLPRWEGWEKVRGILAHLPFNVGDTLNDQSRMIKAALEVDRTSLDGGHGKGLQDIVGVVDGFTSAEVRILSGRGSLLYKVENEHVLKDETLHLGGTLIEWTIPVHFS